MTKQEAQLYWAEKIAEYKKSNLPVRTWCRQQNIDPNRIWYWLRKERGIESGTGQLSPEVESNQPNSRSAQESDLGRQWIALDLNCGPASGSTGVTLRMGAVVIEVATDFEPDHLRRVVQTLSAC